MSARDLSGTAFSIGILAFMQELTAEIALAFGSASGIGEGLRVEVMHGRCTTANVVSENAEKLSSFFIFQDNIVEAAQSFNLQYERVAKLEILQHQAKRINTTHGRSIHGVDYVSWERPFTYVSSF